MVSKTGGGMVGGDRMACKLSDQPACMEANKRHPVSRWEGKYRLGTLSCDLHMHGMAHRCVGTQFQERRVCCDVDGRELV